MTEYIILRCINVGDDDENTWVEHGKASASSAKQAIGATPTERTGAYVAVPARSWRPREVKVEQTTKITIG